MKRVYHWFKGGKLNTSYLALDFHVETGGRQAALIYDSLTETVEVTLIVNCWTKLPVLPGC